MTTELMASLITQGTKRHESDSPEDDRPDYLKPTPYTIAVDTETTGFDWFDHDYPFYATISDYDRDFGYNLEVDQDIEDFKADVRKAKSLIFHNASFDIHMMTTMGIPLEDLLAKEIHDTDLLARIVLGNEVGRFGLKHLATNYVDPEAGSYELRLKECMVSMGLIRKPDQKKDLPDGAYYKAWKAYPQVLETYALKDTRYTYDLFYILMERATPEDLQVYELERQVLPEIIRMEHRGTEIIPERVSELIAKFTVERDQCAERLNELNGYEPINPESGPEVVAFLQRNGIVLQDLTETGEIRTDKGVLERYKGVEVVDLILEHRMVNKLLTTYLGPMEGRSVIHPNFRQIGAWTGRMSCFRPNMQNIPVRSGPEIRGAFRPREGHCFVVADYSSIELRLLAYYMADQALWDIINNGDPFEWMGEQIYGTRDQAQWKVPRSNLKNGTYAIIYGAGGPKLAKTIGGGMTNEEGKALKRSITNTLGKRYYALQRKVRKTIETRGFVRTLAGRANHVPSEKSYVGLNALIQGSAADIMKTAIVAFRKMCAKEGIEAHILLTIHDELVVECKTETRYVVQNILIRAMKNATVSGLHLDVGSVICEENYGEAK